MPKKLPPADDLFESSFRQELEKSAPLADRMRPRDFADFVGQEDVVGEGTPLRRQIESDLISSLVFWGPPGSGKTTLAKIISEKTHSYFHTLCRFSHE